MATVVSNATSSPDTPRHTVPTLPPGPRLPSLLQTFVWALAPTWMMDRCAQSIGESFTITFFPSGVRFVVLSDPQAVKELFTTSAEIAPSGTANSPLAPIMGPSSVLVLTGPEHLRQRKLLLPPFHGERMREYEDTIVDATRKDMATWPIGTPMRLQPRTRAITLEVILRAVFGVEAERMDPLRDAIGAFLKPMNTLATVRIALSRPTNERPAGALGEALAKLDEVIYAEIAQHRAATDLHERQDILSLLMEARDEDGNAMTDSELRDELITMLLAGHETTSTAVSWAIERLVRHPDKLRRLLDEIDAGDGDDYLSAVANETLRVRPVVPLVVRVLTQDHEVGGRLLPAGTRVAPSIWLTNRNPRIYERPREFMPERFLEDSPETFSWIPFGGGIRRCIGASFAQLEMRLILKTVLSELEPSLPESGWRWRRGEPVRRRAVTLVPMAGGLVQWRRRSV
jgi:cytochrome P450 family 135